MACKQLFYKSIITSYLLYVFSAQIYQINRKLYVVYISIHVLWNYEIETHGPLHFLMA